MIAKILLVCALTTSLVFAEHELKRVKAAEDTFKEIMATPDKGIPEDLLQRAHCIAIVPGTKRVAFIAGATYGVGVATCRKNDGGWGGVSTVRIEGGSVGFQIGGGETDVVLLVMNSEGARELAKSEFTVGGDAAVMAGPVGRAVTAQTDAYMRAKILSWSRSRGVFAGIAVKGATLRSDDDANKVLYGKPVKHAEILAGNTEVPDAAASLIAMLNRYSPKEKKSSSE